MGYIYWHGDKAEATGKTETIHGGLFYEYRLVEGHRAGELIVSQRTPIPNYQMIDLPSEPDGPNKWQCDDILGKKHYS